MQSMTNTLTLLTLSACLGACVPGAPEILPPASSVTRREALETSRAYTSMAWRGSPRNVRHGTDEDGIRAAIRERCAGLREIPATPLAVEMGNARVFNSVMMGGLAQLVGGDADVWRSVIADRVAPKVRDLNVRAFDAGLNHTF